MTHDSSTPSPRVLVCHPGRQHSHQLAMALADAGMLAKYITGVPTHEGAGGWIGRRALRSTADAYSLPLDSRLVRHVFIAPVVRRIANRLLPPAAAVDWSHRGEAMFDRYVARSIASYAPDVVVGYENACLEIFRAARRVGARTVLDAASFHHAWQDRFYSPMESAEVHRRIIARKDAELALADGVFTVSELARESYLDEGIVREKVQSMPVGVDLHEFCFRPRPLRTRDSGLEFVFVGQVTELKGVDVLLAAVDQLAPIAEFRLTVVGRGRLTRRVAAHPRCRCLGWVPQRQLAEVFSAADVLVLPSRFDSFAMVVPEAMACGLPAIVSDRVGAREMITPGQNGLIVPAADANALAQAMNELIGRQSELPRMAERARAAAEQYGWHAYRQRAVGAISTFWQSSGRSKVDDLAALA